MMRVLFTSRATLFTSPGGDTTQMLMTAQELRKLGVHVDIDGMDGIQHDPRGYDLVHGFNIIRPADLIGFLGGDHPPMVVSTIYVDYSESNKRAGSWRGRIPPGTLEYLKVVARRLRNGESIRSRRYLLLGHARSIRRLARRCALLLPNSHSEYRRFARDFDVDQKYHVVPNGIDPEVFHDEVAPDARYRDSVVCVGRIEDRKNQLQLIRALKGTGIRLFIIGKPSPNQMSYYLRCKDEAGPEVEFIDHIGHDQLPSVFAAARVHVLPSWFETTGLTSLEAGAMGCRLVVTPKGDQEEYFTGLAQFCDPGSEDSIRATVVDAFQKGRDLGSRQEILAKYTWARAASETLAGYQEALSR